MFEIAGVKFFNSGKEVDRLIQLSNSGGAGMKEAKKQILTHAFKKFLEVDKKISGKKSVQGQKLTSADPNLTLADAPIIVQDDTQKITDNGWELLYRTVDRTAQGSSDSIDVLDITTDFSFQTTLEGEEVKIHDVPSSAKATMTFIRITGGINIKDEWMMFNKFYLVEDVFQSVLRVYFSHKATLAYGVITGLTGVDQAFDTTLIKTINNAIVAVGNNLETDGSLVGESFPYYLLTSRNKFSVTNRAVLSSLILPNDNNSLEQLNSIPRGIITSSKVPTTHIWLVVPEFKNIHGLWRNLEEETDRDILKAANTHVWRSWQNWGVFNSNQIRKIAVS